MDPNKAILFLLNIVLLSFGITAGIFFKINIAPLDFGFSSVFTTVVLTAGFFILSTAFFGMLTPFIFLYFGLTYASTSMTNPIGVTAMSIALLISSSAGNMLGETAEKHMNKKAKFSDYTKKIVMRVCVALLIAVLAGIVFDLGIKPSGIVKEFSKIRTLLPK